MRSANRLLEVVGRNGELQLHLPSAKSPMRYLVDSHTLICLSEMRNVTSNRNKTTWSNTDTRLNPEEFYEPCLNHQISIRELGGVSGINDFMEHLSQAEESQREEGENEAIAELKSLMRGHHIGDNSSGNLKMSGSLAERIAETLIYGKENRRLN